MSLSKSVAPVTRMDSRRHPSLLSSATALKMRKHKMTESINSRFGALLLPS